MRKEKSYKTQIEDLKARGLYGSMKDPYYNRETGGHDCCGSPRAYYHRANCPLCTGGSIDGMEPTMNEKPKWSNLLKNNCPSCNRDLVKTMIATDDQSIACKCGFKISREKYQEICADRVSSTIENDDENREEDVEG